MDKRILIVVFASLILIGLIIAGSPIGLEASEETVESLAEEELFFNSSEYIHSSKNLVLQTITIKNKSPFPKAYKLPKIVVCAGELEFYGTRLVGDLQNQGDYDDGLISTGYDSLEVINVGPYKEESVKIVVSQTPYYGAKSTPKVLTIYKDYSNSYNYISCTEAASKIKEKVEIPIR